MSSAWLSGALRWLSALTPIDMMSALISGRKSRLITNILASRTHFRLTQSSIHKRVTHRLLFEDFWRWKWAFWHDDASGRQSKISQHSIWVCGPFKREINDNFASICAQVHETSKQVAWSVHLTLHLSVRLSVYCFVLGLASQSATFEQQSSQTMRRFSRLGRRKYRLQRPEASEQPVDCWWQINGSD